MKNSSDIASFSITENPWAALKKFTSARIALGRSGISLPTHEQLKFQLAHAQARDAVHYQLDVLKLCSDLQQTFASINPKCMTLHSAAIDRETYLKRPDYGRRLNPVSKYMTLLPTVPRFKERAASRASDNKFKSMPKLRFVASVPAID